MLKQNSREKQANEIYELSAYVESLENKLDVMTSEYVRMSKELSKLKMLNASPTIREPLVGIKETENTLARIEGFEEGIKAANHQLVNSFLVLAGKESKKNENEVYSKNDSSLMRKPWEWQRKVYQSMVQSLNKSIEKVDALSTDVQVQKMRRQWGEIYSKSHDEMAFDKQDNIVLVSEKGHEYGADKFEEYLEKQEKHIVGEHEATVKKVMENDLRR